MASERKPELIVVDTIKDKHGRTVKVGYQGGDVRIAVTSNSLTCAADLDGEQRDRFMRAFAAAELEIERDDAELEHRRDRDAEMQDEIADAASAASAARAARDAREAWNDPDGR